MVPSEIPTNYEELKDKYIGVVSKYLQVEQELEWYRRQFFGKKSEKLPPQNPDQLSLLDKSSETTLPEPPATEVKNYTRAKPGKKPLPKNLPRKQVVHTPKEVVGKEDLFVKIGEDIYEELNYIPASIEIIEHIHPKYKRKNDIDAPILQAPAAYRPIEKGRPGPGLLAQVLVSKYCDHLPLDRQEKIFRRQSIDIPKSTMVHWIDKVCQSFQPIYEAHKKQILNSGYVLSDDTPISVLDKTKIKTSHQGYLWVYGDLQQVFYDYTPTRSREGPENILKDYKGYLQTDGYQGYNTQSRDVNINHLGCWAHVRRKLFELKDKEPIHTREILKLIQQLYVIESSFGEGKIDQEDRQKQAEKIQACIYGILEEKSNTLLPSSFIGKAINYGLNQWPKLIIYQTNPLLKIDNNFAERCIKTVVIGRKNWLFAGSHEGAKRSALIYSLAESCKLQKINPWEYFNDILSRLNEFPMDINSLTPMNWKINRRV
jgi:transposase